MAVESRSSLPAKKGGGWGVVSNIIELFSSGGGGGPPPGIPGGVPESIWRTRMAFSAPTSPAQGPSTPGGQVSLPTVSTGFDPLGAIQRGVRTASGVLEDLAPTLYLIQMLRQLFGGTPNRTGYDYGYPTRYPGGVASPAPIPYPPTPTGTTVTQRSTTMPYSFLPGFDGGGGFLGDLGSLAYGVGSLVNAFSSPTTAPTASNIGGMGGLGFNVPYVDIQSPIVSESTTAAQNACSMAMSPWQTRNAAGVSPKMHVQANPSTGKLVFFAPVRITGVKPYNTGIRRRKRCCSGKR